MDWFMGKSIGKPWKTLGFLFTQCRGSCRLSSKSGSREMVKIQEDCVPEFYDVLSGKETDQISLEENSESTVLRRLRNKHV